MKKNSEKRSGWSIFWCIVRRFFLLVFTLIILAGTFLNLPILADTSRFWDLLEIGLGGYIIGRGSEQLVSSLLKRPRK